MPPVTGITVVYDASCGLCARLKAWIRTEPAIVSVQFVAGGSPDASKRFPQLPPGELAVVANTSEVWIGSRAWIVCLWALRGYRDLAMRLTSPLLIMLASEAFTVVSANRLALSRLLSLRSEREIELQLRKITAPKCQAG